MSSRRNHSSPSKECICNVCENTAVAIPGKTHRRCPGQKGQPIRPKHQNLSGGDRGRWE